MTKFILNEISVESSMPPGTPLLEVIRKEQRLRGSKLACGEGECGACTVLLGRRSNTGVDYKAITSCITPVINASGCHVVTIEAFNGGTLGPVQKAMVDCGGTQCGFCTPGFVVSITGHLLNRLENSTDQLITAVDGNICRCTGYKSIERALSLLSAQFGSQHRPPLDELIARSVVPEYFQKIPARLEQLREKDWATESTQGRVTGGGTDLYVQKPEKMRKEPVAPVSELSELRGIIRNGHRCRIGAAETMHSIQHSEVLEAILPGIYNYLAPVGSTLIRNTATLGGNLVNASPIGDMTILFLALDADITLNESGQQRTVKLRNFYKAYKTIDMAMNGIVEYIEFKIPDQMQYNFDRVCKRTFLDVASVNSACMLTTDSNGIIEKMHLSAGGVAPIPLYLPKTAAFMFGKKITNDTVADANQIIQSEISPISDIRGSEEYKRLLMRQLFFMHMAEFAPESLDLIKLLRA